MLSGVSQLDYQRTIIGYHGTDATVVEGVLSGKSSLDYSENKHDWLGRGIYFWEHGPRRAYEWAQWRIRSGGKSSKITQPAVIGALIHLGNCFDLLDTRNTVLLRKLFPIYKQSCIDQGFEIPKNAAAHKNDLDLTKRMLDCAVVNWVLEAKEKMDGVKYHTVRCVFSEGNPAFEGSSIMEKSHIQIAVRDPAVIIGYFKPNIDTAEK